MNRWIAIAASLALAAGLVAATVLAQQQPAAPERPAPSATSPGAAVDGWRTFSGSWSASGQRDTLPTESGRDAAIVRLSGAVVLTAGDGLSRGFRGEVVGFDDGRARSVGRSVWTDERGDRIFSELQGEPLETGRRFTGTITGGTGRYAGIAGSWTLTWQYVVRAEDGTIQGRTTQLEGRFRRQGAQP